MKLLKKLLFAFPLAGLLFVSCSDWTDVELEKIDHIGGYNTMNNNKSKEYYADLREWKKKAENYGRPVSFGWFSNWAPAGSVRKGYLTAVPDSMDMLSIWSGPFNLTEAKKKDKEFIQKEKGTKVFVCFILHNIGTGITPSSLADDIKKENPDASEAKINSMIKKAKQVYWGFKSGIKGSPDHTEAIKHYAKVLCDSIITNDYDGLDIDWEPNVGGDGYGDLKSDDWSDGGKYLHVLVEALSEYLGPQATVDSGKKRYLLVDGELTSVSPKSGKYFDYFISQAYGSSYLDGRTRSTMNHFGENYNTMKHIFTENFESYSQSGGQLLNQAKYNSKYGPKGGVGAYRFDNDYDNQPDYKFMRQAIQIMHQSYADYLEEHKKNKINKIEE